MSRFNELDKLAITTMRTLAMDAVQASGTGHPGTAMGAADTAYVLWTQFLKHNPANPKWADRDRFVLSAGHASLLLYSLLYMTGYDLSLDEIKRYRQYGGLTPGHPEQHLTPGVETSTGPLGQGFANAVGLAIGQSYWAAYFNRPNFEILDHYTYTFVGDGDLMEGVSGEAASLAGHLELGKLITIYDDNRTTIEGSTELTFTEDRAQRFQAYNWHVQHVDGYDLDALVKALTAAQEDQRPSIIISRSHMAYGSPNKQDNAVAHGAPLGEDEVRLTKEQLGWPLSPDFHVPDEVLQHCRQAIKRGELQEEEWQQTFAAYRREFPELAQQFETFMASDLPADWDIELPIFSSSDGDVAPRIASGKTLNAVAPQMPMLIGGAADLGPSTKSIMDAVEFYSAKNRAGRNLHFGVREHAMGGILNGMALYGGLIPYGSTYFVFSDYMRPSIRLAAFMGLHVIYIFTHDSVLVGSDGPTHQPVEHLASLRAMPNMTVIRPGDANETVGAWKVALQHQAGPVALILARHGIPVLPQTGERSADDVAKGAYILSEAEGDSLDLILLGTGSELHLALGAQEILAQQGYGARVVSMPSWELFAGQPQAYRDEVLPPEVGARLAVEAGSPLGWRQFVGDKGDVIGVSTFGLPATTQEIAGEFNLTTEYVVERALAMLATRESQTA